LNAEVRPLRPEDVGWLADLHNLAFADYPVPAVLDSPALRQYLVETDVDLALSRVALVDGDPVRLTRREFELLRYLVQNKNRVVSRDRLLERVWGYERLVETRSVDVHVGRLRGKLGDAGRQIETVVGLGYRFVD